MSDLAEFYAALDRCLAGGETTAVATIVRTKGSSPREVGAKMLVRPDGATDGTIGGGCGEADVWRAALDVMADREPRTVLVDLTADIAMDTDGVCGGTMQIFVEPWPADDGGAARELARGLLGAMAAKQPILTATVVERSGLAPCPPGARLLVQAGERRAGGLGWPPLEEWVLAEAPDVIASGRSQVRSFAGVGGQGPGVRGQGPERVPGAVCQAPEEVNPLTPGPRPVAPGSEATVSVFFELVLPRPVLVVVGAGHVAVPVAQVGTLLGLEVVVVDDRPSFANPARFPTADRIVVEDFETALDALPITPSTYLVLVTRGHAHDVRSLRKVIDKPAGYIGMIGSRRRVFAVFKLLHNEGVRIESLLRVHAPIGLDIETETPGEIAVSVGAELLKARRGGRAASLSDRVREQYRASLAQGGDGDAGTRRHGDTETVARFGA